MNWGQAYTEGKAFFASGVFYILLGCAFLVVAFWIENFAHSAFVFLVAILGVALVLYGTGTNAVGQGDVGNTKVAIAGGAGVLALVLGLGVVYFQSELTQVFKRTQDYGVLHLSIKKGSSVGLVGLTTFDIRAQSEGHSLPLMSDQDSVDVLVPIVPGADENYVEIKLQPRTGIKELTGYAKTFPIVWSDKKHVQRRPGFNNEVVPKYTDDLDLSANDMVSMGGAQLAIQ